MAVYLDASAVVKLVQDEPETSALLGWLQGREDLVSSDLVRTEALRAAATQPTPVIERTRDVLDALHLTPVATSVTEAAGVLLPGHPVRSLDALHVATALTSGDDLEAFITYDDRQGDAARRVGLRVIAPGRDSAAAPGQPSPRP